MDLRTARIARETLVDVATPTGSVGCIDAIRGTKVKVAVGNPLCYDDGGWYDIGEIQLCGQAAHQVVAKYL